jgi:16S rRNA G966 N2-methylase RsmD
MMKKEFPDYKKALTADLIPYARNSRTHSPQQVDKVAASIKEFGFLNPVIIDGKNGIIAGHCRVLAAQKLGMNELPVIEASHLTDAQRRAYVIADNRLALDAGWDDEMLRVEFAELGEADFDLTLTGFSLDEIAALEMDHQPEDSDLPGDGPARTTLAERFGIPPFSVLNAREGWWQSRKREWLALGIRSELGRGDNGTAAPGGSAMCATDNSQSRARGDGAGRSKFGKCMETGIGASYGREEMNATSIFDPVLCELAYSWFSPQGGTVLDPFAGGSVRGIVASRTGRQYIGVELRPEQVEANRIQGNELCPEMPPVWHAGDSRNIDRICHDVDADFVFSCPPYADLEVYSDDPQDLSTLNYSEFRDAYFEIIAKSCERLKQDRFACFVVGDVRDKKGNYYNFVGDTVEAFRAAGLHYYNEAILVTAVGSLPIRAGKQFTSGRKLGKTHQNVLVFVKGEGKKAAQACGVCDFGDIPENEHADLGEPL